MSLTPYNDNIKLNAPKALDQRTGKFFGGAWLPYASVAEANTAILPEYRAVGLTVNIAIAGINTEYWYRDGILDADLIQKGAAIVAGTFFTADTNTLFLSGDGSVGTPVLGDVQVSKNSNNGIQALPDGLYSAQTIRQGVVYGGIVTWVNNYNYTVSAAGYYINGVFHTSPAANFTLGAPDGTFNRIDTFIVNESGAAAVLAGTPSSNPAQAALNPATQLQLSFALVETGTTQPSTGTECIYIDNAEWTSLSSSVRINANSTSSPCNGTKSVEATSTLSGDNIKFTRSGLLNPLTNYTILKFSIKSKGAFGGKGSTKRKLILQFRNGSTNVGNAISILNGSYGFVDTNTTDCQNIAIPLTDFGFPAVPLIDNLLITTGGIGTILGFRLDDICFQGVPVPPPPLTGGITADNGLNMSTPTNVQLGGTLTGNTTITGADKDFIITNTRSTYSYALEILASGINNRAGLHVTGQDYAIVGDGVLRGVYGKGSAYGVLGEVTDTGGTAIQALSRDGISVLAQSNSTIGTGIQNMLSIIRGYSGAASNGVGASIYYQIPTATPNQGGLSNELISKWTDATVATRTSQFIITGVNSAVTADLFTINGNGSYKFNKYGVNTFAGVAAYALGVDASGNVVEFAAGGGGGGTYTVDSGLTASTSTNFQLGGTLLHDTSITVGTHTLSINKSSSSRAFEVINTAGNALEATGSTVGVFGSSLGIPAWFVNTDSTANQSRHAILLTRGGGFNSSAGVGVEIDFEISNSTGSTVDSGYIKNILTTATSGAEVSSFEFYLTRNLVIARKLAIAGNGMLTLDGYTTPVTSGAAVYSLNVDASGNVVTGAIGGGADTNFATNDLTFTGNRTHTLGTNTLLINNPDGLSLYLREQDAVLRTYRLGTPADQSSVISSNSNAYGIANSTVNRGIYTAETRAYSDGTSAQTNATLSAYGGGGASSVEVDVAKIQFSTISSVYTFPNMPSYANDAAADADASLLTKALYKITGNRTIFQKP